MYNSTSRWQQHHHQERVSRYATLAPNNTQKANTHTPVTIDERCRTPAFESQRQQAALTWVPPWRRGSTVQGCGDVGDRELQTCRAPGLPQHTVMWAIGNCKRVERPDCPSPHHRTRCCGCLPPAICDARDTPGSVERRPSRRVARASARADVCVPPPPTYCCCASRFEKTTPTSQHT
jgi:hypothetical protein